MVRYDTIEEILKAKNKYAEWCEYLFSTIKDECSTLQRVSNTKTSVALRYRKTNLINMSPEQLTEVLEAEESKDIEKWEVMVGSSFYDI